MGNPLRKGTKVLSHIASKIHIEFKLKQDIKIIKIYRHHHGIKQEIKETIIFKKKKKWSFHNFTSTNDKLSFVCIEFPKLIFWNTTKVTGKHKISIMKTTMKVYHEWVPTRKCSMKKKSIMISTVGKTHKKRREKEIWKLTSLLSWRVSWKIIFTKCGALEENIGRLLLSIFDQPQKLENCRDNADKWQIKELKEWLKW